MGAILTSEDMNTPGAIRFRAKPEKLRPAVGLLQKHARFGIIWKNRAKAGTAKTEAEGGKIE